MTTTLPIGNQLFNQATKYLEEQSFEDCDFSSFFLPEAKYGERPGIGLGHSDHTVAICMISNPALDRSHWIEVTDPAIMQKILGLLIFAIKEA